MVKWVPEWTREESLKSSDGDKAQPKDGLNLSDTSSDEEDNSGSSAPKTMEYDPTQPQMTGTSTTSSQPSTSGADVRKKTSPKPVTTPAPKDVQEYESSDRRRGESVTPRSEAQRPHRSDTNYRHDAEKYNGYQQRKHIQMFDNRRRENQYRMNDLDKDNLIMDLQNKLLYFQNNSNPYNAVPPHPILPLPLPPPPPYK